ncbi:hypothetical protein LOTGIDRAFT_170772 [Lottia gigantea]|uniref:Uncharacterized protein n=1 Tax=Lottia gigantea TaxID=225164 RepID=V4AK05_LOTGI|nr:hypothetical protein LOTGIDRAFT_170772 [Lottia gigantea]ESP04529.1 hypothetical protein LOTGIDRAFT_170772 [Lottia gigantea]
MSAFKGKIRAVCSRRLKQITVVLTCVILVLVYHFASTTTLYFHPQDITQWVLSIPHNTSQTSSLTLQDFQNTSSNNVQLTSPIRSLPALSKYTMTLTLRLTSTKHLTEFLYCQALRSTALYWSKRLGNVALIFDAENPNDKYLAENLKKHQSQMGINFVFVYENLPEDQSILSNTIHRNPGYNRQVYSSFFMDLYINTSIIAWTDTDGRFTSPVTLQNIFAGDKLKVKGMSAFQHSHIAGWARITQEMLGKSQVSDFMEYFPVYIWRDTITNCRNHIIQHMKVRDMDEAFVRVLSRRDNISPVNIIMSYAYYFEKHRYDWHINLEKYTLENYNNKFVSKGFELLPSDITPDLHVTIHHKYYKDRTHTVNKEAYCAAIKNTAIQVEAKVKAMCQPFLNKVPWLLFKFNTWSTPQYLPAWCKNESPVCKLILDNHLKNVQKAITEGFYDLDLKKVSAVESAAREFGYSCTPFF